MENRETADKWGVGNGRNTMVWGIEGVLKQGQVQEIPCLCPQRTCLI